MEENPFSALIQMMKGTAKGGMPVLYRFGVVVSEDEEPIKRVLVGKIEYKSNCGEMLVSNGMSLKKGDVLFLIPLADEQQILIICKVVAL